ncbi:hypothetical protein [Sandaracinus amylolyticus]|uniref:hypothetical protein n=1 Tax=Sandaracinus amylolyticus TaxID=927083 RepID=UPI001F35AA35|nr:hypothetical protein [Sandaracinus amylolyticus]UJR86952.1 Hypothetical protein I5071_90530 [Sandaracinus amylolyticus]
MTRERAPASPTTKRAELFLAGGAAALLVAQQVAGKATRDALFLTSFDPRRLPIVMGAGALLSLLAVLAMSNAMAVRGPSRTVPAALGVNATFFAIEWLAQPLFRDGVAVAIYLHVAALGSVLISGFWTLVSERYDPRRARAFVSRVAAGGTFGGVLGGVSADVIAGNLGARPMLLVLAGASIAAGALIHRFGRGLADEDGTPLSEPQTARALKLVGRTPYLRTLSALSLLAAVWAALLDYAFKAQADAAYVDETSLVRFFAWFYTGTSLVTFLVQSGLGRTVLDRLPLYGIVALSPLVVAFGGLGLLLGLPFGALIVLRGAESVLSNSLYRSAYELFFTPLPPQTKRPTKTLVDVAATRVGDALGSLAVLALIYGWHDMPGIVPAVVAAGAALFSLLLVPSIARGYVEALQEALRSGTLELDEQSALDATTRRTLSDTAMAIDRERLLAEIESLRRQSPALSSIEAAAIAAATADVQSHPEPQVEGEAPPAVHPTEPSIVQRFAAIASGAIDRTRAALDAPLDAELVPITLHLLAHPELGRDALAALRRVAPSVTGTLIDALLDLRTPFEIRFRIPRVLRVSTSRRAAEGLISGLDDPRLEVRFQCARALVHLASTDSALAPPSTVVFGAVERELGERGATWSAVATIAPHDPNHPDHHDDEPISLDELVRMRASRSLQYVLTLLSLVVEGESLQLALRGLSAHDEKIRGTAIELLENVVPEPVRSSLIPVLAARPRSEIRARSREEIVAELLRSQESLPIVRPRG